MYIHDTEPPSCLAYECIDGYGRHLCSGYSNSDERFVLYSKEFGLIFAAKTMELTEIIGRPCILAIVQSVGISVSVR